MFWELLTLGEMGGGRYERGQIWEGGRYRMGGGAGMGGAGMGGAGMGGAGMGGAGGGANMGGGVSGRKRGVGVVGGFD